ncbi:MAG: ATP-dependent helicase [Candidatus Thiodiazotropha lotti]|nr:ATP-dependent helicase [Candidatus Thiodiazotropha lotti]
MIPVDAWRPADGLTLEPNAFKAATEKLRSQVLTAGPGAGKTEMLAQRSDFLLRTGTCRYPKRILAISFKVDASRNLKERVRRRCGADLASRFDSFTFHAFAKRIIDRFRPLLTGDDALDMGYTIGDRRIARKQIEFGDLVPFAIQILNGSNLARNAVRHTYSDVFLDEFQDCTDKQYELVRTAFAGTAIRLTAVGDSKQRIMGWAGALDGIFQIFAQDFAARSLNLYLNFRSKPRLLRVQNEIIRTLDPPSVMPDEQIVGDDGEVLTWRFEDGQQEGEYLAEVISGWINAEHFPLSEIAVLVSKQLDLYAVHLMEALQARGIPFRNEQQMQDITTEPAARLIVDYLSCLFGSREPNAWMRLVTQMFPFAGEEEQMGIRRNVDRLIRQQRSKFAEREGGPYSLWWQDVEQFLREIGTEFLVALSPDYENQTRLGDVLLETREHIGELLRLESNLPNALERFSDDQAVRILTIHKSKGLEFDSVVMMAVEDEIFFGNQDENRCAFFVGVSRAKTRLILTHADRRDRPDGFRGRWYEVRTPRSEYFGYCNPFVSG